MIPLLLAIAMQIGQAYRPQTICIGFVTRKCDQVYSDKQWENGGMSALLYPGDVVWLARGRRVTLLGPIVLKARTFTPLTAPITLAKLPDRIELPPIEHTCYLPQPCPCRGDWCRDDKGRWFKP